jgi:integrase
MTDPPVTSSNNEPVPTFEQFQARAVAACTPFQARAYAPVWRQVCSSIGNKPLDRITTLDLRIFQQGAVRNAAKRASSRGGRYAGERTVRAFRAFFKLAEQDGWIKHQHNPAAKLPLPRRKPSTRRGLTRHEVAEINEVVPVGSQDAALDCLIIRLHLETACRRGGALGLRLADLDTRWCLVRLHEKGGTVRWQPISPTLASALEDHARARGAVHGHDALLRRRDHLPISTRHYDAPWQRIRTLLPWAGEHGISAHWLRHTTITWVERRFGYAIARAYAGHTDTASAPTSTFIRARLVEVAGALSALTGEPHPLLQPATPPRASATSHGNLRAARKAKA